MSYYRGDYYRGDNYYRGDFLGLGKLAKGIAGIAGSVFRASPIGQVVGAVANIVHPSLPTPKGTALALSGQGPSGQFGLINIGGTGTQGGLLNIGGVGGPPPAALMAGAPPTKGYHLNRSTYETRGGGTSRWGPAGNLQEHVKGTVLVRNRRMNVGNARALKRALRRASGFARLARRVMSFTHPRAGRGHFKFKKRGKR